MATKYDKLLDKYENYGWKAKVEVLEAALEHMEENRDLNHGDCIVLAMGGTLEDIKRYYEKV